MGRRRRAGGLALLLAAGLLVVLVQRRTTGPGDAVPPTGGPAATASAVVAAGALRELDGLPVKGRAPRTGYSRERFGPAWDDVDGNGCDTRNDILRRDLTDRAVLAGSGGCIVTAGRLDDPYSGRALVFSRGAGTSAVVQIDHVVALSDAWQTGAAAIGDRQRLALANDPMNLLAVDGHLNQQKGDGDAATWLPPARTSWCLYAVRQVEVKARYHL